MAAGQRRAFVEGSRITQGTSSANERTPVRFGLDFAHCAGTVADHVCNMDVRLTIPALAARGVNCVAALVDLSLHEHLGKCGMGRISIVIGQHQFGVGRHFDDTVLRPGIRDDNTPAFAVGIRSDDGLYGRMQRAGFLDELRLVIGEDRGALFAGDTYRIAGG